VANITHDPILFVKTAFCDIPSGEFVCEDVDGRPVCRLKDASSWVIYETRVDQKTDQKILVSLTPVLTRMAQEPLVPVNRGLNSIIEAAVHGTRYLLTRDPRLKELIDHHGDLVRRCGGEREQAALELLYDFIR
jgi:hypothetical protein